MSKRPRSAPKGYLDILFVFADRALLAAESLCGGQPPMAWQWRPDGLWRAWNTNVPTVRTRSRTGVRNASARALALTWDDKPLTAGLDLLYRAAKGRSERVAPADWHASEMIDAEWLALECERLGLGRAVFIDGDGREIK